MRKIVAVGALTGGAGAPSGDIFPMHAVRDCRRPPYEERAILRSCVAGALARTTYLQHWSGAVMCAAPTATLFAIGTVGAMLGGAVDRGEHRQRWRLKPHRALQCALECGGLPALSHPSLI